MRTPQFGLRSLLMAITVVALWLSTFSGFDGSEDLRRCLRLLIVVVSVLAFYCAVGKLKLFWLGFAGIWVLSYVSNDRLLPEFIWMRQWMDFGPFDDPETSAKLDTVRTLALCVVGSIAGLIGTVIYDPRGHKE